LKELGTQSHRHGKDQPSFFLWSLIFFLQFDHFTLSFIGIELNGGFGCLNMGIPQCRENILRYGS
jgi:hypothetical protein